MSRIPTHDASGTGPPSTPTVRPGRAILLIGDAGGSLTSMLSETSPATPVCRVGSVFDGLAEVATRPEPFGAVLLDVEPVERRPEPAVRAIRDAVGPDARVILYGDPTLEPLSRKMLSFGADDYLLTPPELPALRAALYPLPGQIGPDAPLSSSAIDVEPLPPDTADGRPSVSTDHPDPLTLADVLLDALLLSPQRAAVTAADRLKSLSGMEFHETRPDDKVPSTPIRPDDAPADAAPVGWLTHIQPLEQESRRPTEPADPWAARWAGVLGKLATLDERYTRLQALAITDDLTGLHNARWFRHFLERILVKAKVERFPVTLLLFDIDDFKRYNDEFGHGVGDDILRQTADLMKRCCRSHDLVARIGGDEFAVVFWEKDAPRQPYDAAGTPGPRPAQSPVQIAQRFRKLLRDGDFPALGESGRGNLTISGGMAVYPYDARDAEGLIAAADEALMFGAKKWGKDAIHLVGQQEPSQDVE